jgi:hypothetical protein
MMQAKGKRWGAVVAAALALAPVVQPGYGGYAPAHAAEQQIDGITKEDAIRFAQQWVTIPADYKLERSSYLEERRAYPFGKPVWRLSWEKQRDGYIYVTIDASTGDLLELFRYGKEREDGQPVQSISAEQAEKKAWEFVQRVAPKEDLEKLSKPNEYSSMSPALSGRVGEHAVTFTRIENGTPFLENGYRLVVGGTGDILHFQRVWYEGALPDVKGVVSLEQAERLMTEKLSPSLVYAQKGPLFGDFTTGLDSYALVYKYMETDPQLLDAVKGTPLNFFGEPADQAAQVKTLGTTVRAANGSQRVITKEEAQKIAEEYIKKLPGSYRSEGSGGGGSSTGPDGITRRYWSFEFTPLHVQGNRTEPIELGISDRGELYDYRANERAGFGEDGRKIEKAVPWEQARDNAVKLVTTLLNDRLGEIYLLDRKPTEEALKEILERGGRFSIRFGWQKEGIPIEGAELEASVHPETGEVEWLRVRDDNMGTPDGTKGKVIDAEAAKKVEREQKKPMLTYYLPPEWKVDIPIGNRKPLLVYRYVGDQGVVDAVTGKWLSFEEMRRKKTPEDIANHPAKEALQFAINANLLTVKDGKLEPDKPLTRGEMAGMMARMVNRSGFYERLHRPFYDDDEESKPYVFADVDQKHPMYAAIQKCVQLGLIPKEGTRFEPDRAITRGEAAEMVVRLFGYEELLTKQQIFVSPYQDVDKKLVPAVSLAYAYGLFPTKSPKVFEPSRPMTRAEAAQLMQNLQKIGERP